MPDFCMCSNRKCKSRKQCLRYLSVPNKYRQSYSHFCSKEANPTKFKCDFYVYASKGKQVYYPIRSLEEADQNVTVLFES